MSEQEFDALMQQARDKGAVVEVTETQVTISGLKGVGPFPITGRLHAAEILRKAMAV